MPFFCLGEVKKCFLRFRHQNGSLGNTVSLSSPLSPPPLSFPLSLLPSWFEPFSNVDHQRFRLLRGFEQQHLKFRGLQLKLKVFRATLKKSKNIYIRYLPWYIFNQFQKNFSKCLIVLKKSFFSNSRSALYLLEGSVFETPDQNLV